MPSLPEMRSQAHHMVHRPGGVAMDTVVLRQLWLHRGGGRSARERLPTLQDQKIVRPIERQRSFPQVVLRMRIFRGHGREFHDMNTMPNPSLERTRFRASLTLLRWRFLPPPKAQTLNQT